MRGGLGARLSSQVISGLPQHSQPAPLISEILIPTEKPDTMGKDQAGQSAELFYVRDVTLSSADRLGT